MYLALVSKAARLLLAVSVSVWMAGGCLFGCSNGEVMAAEGSRDPNDSIGAAVSAESCNKARQHDCCTQPTTQKTKPRKSKAPIARRQATDGFALTGIPHGMKDCPLMTNATAVTAKSNGDLPNVSHSFVALLPAFKNTNERTESTPAQSYLPNRGPTHLRCCVFLI